MKYQDIIADSSTESESIAASETGKVIIYIIPILDKINIPQDEATVVYEDKQGVLLMENIWQPTKHTRPMLIKDFQLQDWVLKDLLILQRMTNNDNDSDALTKAVPCILFYYHMNIIVGKLKPAYVTMNALP